MEPRQRIMSSGSTQEQPSGSDRRVADPTRPMPRPRYELMTESVLRQAREGPERVALRHARREWTYAELSHRAKGVAQHLVGLGVLPGDVVAVTGPRSGATVVALLGTFLSGATVMPLDPRLPLERRRAMASHAGVRHIVALDGTATEDIADADVVRVDPSSGALRDPPIQHAVDAALPGLDPAAAAYVFFTSGSTGTPKGVVGTHEGIAHFLAWQRAAFDVSPQDRAAQTTSLSFDMILRDMFLVLSAGGTLCIPEESELLDPSAIFAWMNRERVTILHVVPSLLRAWLSHAPAQVQLPSLRHVFLAGEPLTDALLRHFTDVVGDHPLVTNLYGPTETTMVKCFHSVHAIEEGIQPIGRPQPDTEIWIRDPQGRLCGVGERGEICIRTPFRTLGYLDDPEATRGAFFVNPFRDDPTDLVYRTGDIGELRADGLLCIHGRMDDQVKIRGVRVEPAEVEAALARHPDVAGAAVVARADAAGSKFLAAYVIPRESDASPPPDAVVAGLRAWLRGFMPEHMVPASFRLLDSFPLLPNGKVDRRALPNAGQATPDPVSAESPVTAAGEPGRQQQLLGIWSAALGHPDVTLDDSFVELGGDSLSAITALVRMKRMGIPSDIARGIFQGWSIRQILGRTGVPTTPEELPPLPLRARTNLLVNVVRGLLVAVLVAGHWIEGLLNHLPRSLGHLGHDLLPLFNVATPGFAIIFGLSLGYVYLPRFQRDPRQAVKGLRLGVWLVLGGILVRSAATLAIAKLEGEPLHATAFFNSFYSALLYYALALATAPVWFRLIGHGRAIYARGLVMMAASYGLFRLAEHMLLDHEQEGLLQLGRLMLVAKFNYFNMSLGALAGLMAGAWLHAWAQGPGDLRWLAPRLLGLGMGVSAIGLGLFALQAEGLRAIYDAAAMSLARWVFYGGTILVLSGVLSRILASYEQLASPLRVGLNLTGTLGQVSLPVFVLHQLVLQAKTLSEHAGLPGLLALVVPLAAFLWLCLWMMRKIYALYYGSPTDLRGPAPVATAEAYGG